jgi:hypothetical protein
MTQRCPGQDTRNLRIEQLRCPKCGYQAEIFSDEIKVKCVKCGNLICRQRLPSCVDWCKFSRECVDKAGL